MTGMLALSEGCIAAVISFTTPCDACRLACVSTTFRSAADSDVVWDRFLPPEYSSCSSSSSSTTWSALSKKELYFRICHNLIHKGKMSFWFDLLSGKKCYMISPRELNIVNGDDIYEWGWYSIPDDVGISWWDQFNIPNNCRFPEVVKRVNMIQFEIGGKITTSLLSPMTTYIAYLVFAENAICWVYDDPAEVSIGLAGSDNGQNRTVYIHREQQDGDDDGFYPKMRADGWLETELGEFFNGDNEEAASDGLEINFKVSSALVEIVWRITTRPRYIISKLSIISGLVSTLLPPSLPVAFDEASSSHPELCETHIQLKIEAQKKNAVKNQKSKGSQLVSLRPEPLLSKLAAPFVRSLEHRGNRKA
ncbi:hypothetical protein LWI29_031591 [Acer saccharum]|uniref:F-box domain-containing protein n=1 Tax=Acer saccharum TaxID=4024 RepID=A0AA39RWY5_ACESA|nr:hypothetical protein LWI29_031591 [Acer saccharum]